MNPQEIYEKQAKQIISQITGQSIFSIDNIKDLLDIMQNIYYRQSFKTRFYYHSHTENSLRLILYLNLKIANPKILIISHQKQETKQPIYKKMFQALGISDKVESNIDDKQFPNPDEIFNHGKYLIKAYIQESIPHKCIPTKNILFYLSKIKPENMPYIKVLNVTLDNQFNIKQYKQTISKCSKLIEIQFDIQTIEQNQIKHSQLVKDILLSTYQQSPHVKISLYLYKHSHSYMDILQHNPLMLIEDAILQNININELKFSFQIDLDTQCLKLAEQLKQIQKLSNLNDFQFNFKINYDSKQNQKLNIQDISDSICRCQNLRKLSICLNGYDPKLESCLGLFKQLKSLVNLQYLNLNVASKSVNTQDLTNLLQGVVECQNIIQLQLFFFVAYIDSHFLVNTFPKEIKKLKNLIDLDIIWEGNASLHSQNILRKVKKLSLRLINFTQAFSTF